MLKKCEHCGEDFISKSSERKFCKQKCFRNWRKGKTYEEMYGADRAHEIKAEQREKALKLETHKHGKKFCKGHKINNGREPWNKGLVGAQEAWNKGLVMKNYYDEEQYKKFIDACILGGVRSKISVSNRNEKTKIEVAIENILEELGIKFLSQYPLLGITIADAYLPDHHIAIYADGDYWHNYPHGTKKDHEVTKELQNSNIKVMRFWECDIKNNISKIKESIRDVQRL